MDHLQRELEYLSQQGRVTSIITQNYFTLRCRQIICHLNCLELYRKTLSRGAYGHDPVLSVFEEYPLDSTRSDSTMTLSII